MELSYLISRDQLTQAYFQGGIKVRGIRVKLFLLSLILGVLAALLVRVLAAGTVLGYLLLAALVLLVTVLLVVRWLDKKSARTLPKEVHVHLTLGAEGVVIALLNLPQVIVWEWPYVERIISGKNGVWFIMKGSQGVEFVPAHAFSSPSRQQMFVSLAEHYRGLEPHPKKATRAR